MVNALVVRRNTQLERLQRAQRAAQYVRASTDKQRYSTQNQAAVIAAYAYAHGLTIVRTYSDEGESGLRIKNRAGLREMIQDVCSGKADYDYVLVYDVSRWGRFQDTDESAHYEFVCKQEGVKVAYCAEQFDNDGSMLSSIMKNLKRVMAAEYSREISVKVHAGACRFARLGCQMGGPVPYALQRMLVDETLQPKGILKNGERKYLQSDHVKLQPGSAKEVTVVKWIFHRFIEVRSEKAIAHELNRHGIPAPAGSRWIGPFISRILKNENYVGNMLYNRRSTKLRGKHVNNPPNVWIRSEGCIEPIVGLDVFLAARKIIKERRVDLPEQEMLARLRRTLKKEGRLSPTIINKTVGLPSHQVYIAHFGSLRNAYRLIGYSSERNCDWIDARQVWADVWAKLASQITAGIEKIGGRIVPDGSTQGLHVNGTVKIFFRVARQVLGEREHYAARWIIHRRRLPDGWIVVVRLGDRNKSVLDYLLVPTNGTDRYMVRFSEEDRARLGMDRFETSDALVRAISRRATRSTGVSSTKPARPNKQSKSNQSKKLIRGARR